MSDGKSKAVARSLARGKESGYRFASELAKEGLNALIPGGGLVYAGVEALVKHGMHFYEDRKKTRIEAFHENILSGDPEAAQQVLDREFSIEDYTLLLSHSVQDEEDEKVEIYGRLFKALQRNLLPANFKLHILKSSRNLSLAEFDLMREIFVAAKFKFKDEGDLERQVAQRTVSSEPMLNLAVQNLVRQGYLYEKTSDSPPYPTALLNTIVQAIYQDEELIPEAVGQEVWLGQIFLGSFDLAGYSGLLGRTTYYLEKHNIKTVMAVPQGNAAIVLGMSSHLVMFLDQETQAKGEEFLRENHKYHDKMVKVYLPGSSRMAITEGRTFTFEKVDEESIKDFAGYLFREFAYSSH